DRLRQPRHLGRLAGHERVRLDVELAVLRRALGPRLCHPLVGERAVRRIDLHDRELARVEPQPLLRAPGALGIEDSRCRHRRVGPARGAETDLAFVGFDRRPRRILHGLAAPPPGVRSRVVRVYASHSVMNRGERWMSIWRRTPRPLLTIDGDVTYGGGPGSGGPGRSGGRA